MNAKIGVFSLLVGSAIAGTTASASAAAKVLTCADYQKYVVTYLSQDEAKWTPELQLMRNKKKFSSSIAFAGDLGWTTRGMVTIPEAFSGPQEMIYSAKGGPEGTVHGVVLCEYQRVGTSWTTLKVANSASFIAQPHDESQALSTYDAAKAKVSSWLGMSATTASKIVDVRSFKFEPKHADKRIFAAFAVLLDPKNPNNNATIGNAKFSLTLRPAQATTAVVTAPSKSVKPVEAADWHSITDWGVDRGDAFSSTHIGSMTSRHKDLGITSVNQSMHKCLGVVKDTLQELKDVDESEATVPAFEFQNTLRSPVKPTTRWLESASYKEIKSNFTYKDLPLLRDKLPIGSLILYKANDDSAGFSTKYGHIDAVVRYNGKKSLMSDYINKNDDGWGWLGGTKSKTRNMNMWVFVPTKK